MDVFGGSKTSSQTAPPPPVMPLGGGTYSGNFFVPTAAGVCMCVSVCACLCVCALYVQCMPCVTPTPPLSQHSPGSADGLGESMAYFSGSEQPFPTESTAAQPS